MDWWVIVLILVGLIVLGLLGQRFGLIDLRPSKKRSGGVAGLVGGVDEVFFPTKHEAQIELDRQTRLPAPAPLPGDGDKGIYHGQVVIELDAADGEPVAGASEPGDRPAAEPGA